MSLAWSAAFALGMLVVFQSLNVAFLIIHDHRRPPQ